MPRRMRLLGLAGSMVMCVRGAPRDRQHQMYQIPYTSIKVSPVPHIVGVCRSKRDAFVAERSERLLEQDTVGEDVTRVSVLLEAVAPCVKLQWPSRPRGIRRVTRLWDLRRQQ